MACGHSKSAPIIKTMFGTPVIIIFGLSGGGICFLGGLHRSVWCVLGGVKGFLWDVLVVGWGDVSAVK